MGDKKYASGVHNIGEFQRNNNKNSHGEDGIKRGSSNSGSNRNSDKDFTDSAVTRDITTNYIFSNTSVIMKDDCSSIPTSSRRGRHEDANWSSDNRHQSRWSVSHRLPQYRHQSSHASVSGSSQPFKPHDETMTWDQTVTGMSRTHGTSVYHEDAAHDVTTATAPNTVAGTTTTSAAHYHRHAVPRQNVYSSYTDRTDSSRQSACVPFSACTPKPSSPFAKRLDIMNDSFPYVGMDNFSSSTSSLRNTDATASRAAAEAGSSSPLLQTPTMSTNIFRPLLHPAPGHTVAVVPPSELSGAEHTGIPSHAGGTHSPRISQWMMKQQCQHQQLQTPTNEKRNRNEQQGPQKQQQTPRQENQENQYEQLDQQQQRNEQQQRDEQRHGKGLQKPDQTKTQFDYRLLQQNGRDLDTRQQLYRQQQHQERQLRQVQQLHQNERKRYDTEDKDQYKGLQYGECEQQRDQRQIHVYESQHERSQGRVQVQLDQEAHDFHFYGRETYRNTENEMSENDMYSSLGDRDCDISFVDGLHIPRLCPSDAYAPGNSRPPPYLPTCLRREAQVQRLLLQLSHKDMRRQRQLHHQHHEQQHHRFQHNLRHRHEDGGLWIPGRSSQMYESYDEQHQKHSDASYYDSSLPLSGSAIPSQLPTDDASASMSTSGLAAEAIPCMFVPEVVQHRYHSLFILDTPTKLQRQQIMLQQLYQQQRQLPSLSVSFCGYPTIVYKALCFEDTHPYALRVIEALPISNFDLVKAAVRRWSKVSCSHAGLVGLRQSFATADFAARVGHIDGSEFGGSRRLERGRAMGSVCGGEDSSDDGEGVDSERGNSHSRSSVVFVYDYYPNVYTLEEIYLNDNDFTSASLHQSGISEDILWSIIIQLLLVLVHIHKHGLFYGVLTPDKVLVNHRMHLRLNACGIKEATMYEPHDPPRHPRTAFVSSSSSAAAVAARTSSAATLLQQQSDSSVPGVRGECIYGDNAVAVAPTQQQKDIIMLGKVVLALACGTSKVYTEDTLHWVRCLLSRRQYSGDVKSCICSLLQPGCFSSENILHTYSYKSLSLLHESMYLCDHYETFLFREIHKNRLFLLLLKLCSIVDRGGLCTENEWSEVGERYILKLFRDYLFFQKGMYNEPVVDISHICNCLYKLDISIDENITLMSRDNASIIICSYDDINRCLNKSFEQLVVAAARVNIHANIHTRDGDNDTGNSNDAATTATAVTTVPTTAAKDRNGDGGGNHLLGIDDNNRTVHQHVHSILRNHHHPDEQQQLLQQVRELQQQAYINSCYNNNINNVGYTFRQQVDRKLQMERQQRQQQQ